MPTPAGWGPAAEGMVFLAGLTGPAVDAVHEKPDGVDVHGGTTMMANQMSTPRRPK